MTQFTEAGWFDVETCCNCHMKFALSTEFKKERLKDREIFYCPAGHKQHYSGKSEEQRLKDELARKQEMLDSANARATANQQKLNNVSRAHHRMRERVMNGVCPCCNRSFSNLREHMKTQHADFAVQKTLFALRSAFGMTQSLLATEAGVDAAHVSLYERGKPVASYAKRRLDEWIEQVQV